MASHTKNFLENNHHAYCVAGEPEKMKGVLFSALEREWNIDTTRNPDLSYAVYDSFGVDDARAIALGEQNKSFSGGKKIFIIQANGMTVEAQNALLKLFEEPSDMTRFFLLGNAVKNLLPTFLSRMCFIEASGAEGNETPEDVSAFLRAGYAKRIEIAKKLADDIKNEKRSRTDAINLLNGIEKNLYESALKEGVLPGKLFEKLEFVRTYLQDRSASVKMLLEFAALVIPTQNR